jgi:hypothetical protein
MHAAARPSRWPRLLLGAIAWSAAGAAFAWIYPEHRDIAVLAVQGLDAERQAAFDRIWQEARAGDDRRMCAPAADAAQGVTPECIDWAALSAIAGDHSCSAAGMLETVRKADWILAVADVAAQLKADLSRIPVTARPDQAGGATAADIIAGAERRLADEASRAQRLNALRSADTRMQRADPKYATRADANLAHFLLPRPDTGLDPLSYGTQALQPGAPLNAIGVYAWYHISALQMAGRLANERLTPDERRTLARAALFDEAFALHFLEDSFAAGHIAGSWGGVAQRKGTHDFYNQNGLEVFTWKGREKTVVLMGDAHIRPEDAAIAADSVRKSILQVLDAAAGRSPVDRDALAEAVPLQAEVFDVCKSTVFPERGLDLGRRGRGPYAHVLGDVLLETPVPGLGPGLGSLPRARSEVGPFAGVAASISGRVVGGGFDPSQSKTGVIAGLDMAVRVGLGLEGALGDAGDGLAFVQLGLSADTASTNKFSDAVTGSVGGGLSAAIPSRAALSTRFRMPYYLIPGDLLLLSPMAFFDREKYTQIAVTASNGGVLGWQQGLATRFGRFQFVLGRELGVTFHGNWGDPRLLLPPDPPGTGARAVGFKSTYYELPILEYRPYRAFSADQSSAILIQLFAGADVPYGLSVKSPPGAAAPGLRTVWTVGLRMTLDWRYYWK